MGLITETNAQYYSGQQKFIGIVGSNITCTFNTDLIGTVANVSNTNFSVTKNGVLLVEGALTNDYSLSTIKPNQINFTVPLVATDEIIVTLIQPAINANYGSYEYVSLVDVVNNFMLAYVGMDKLIPRVKRSDVIFHAKRGLQEFSYDTLKSINSQELTIPPSLSIPIPQDYVNYVRVSRIDESGVQRIIYPVNNLTTSPKSLPIQDANGVPTQNSFGSNNQASESITEKRWNEETQNNITGEFQDDDTNVYDWEWWKLNFGQRYGLDPQTSQGNGWFQINERLGTFSFSSDLANKLIVLEYISDGLAYDMDSKVPKMAEDALYAHINYSILSTRSNTQEYIVQRYKRDRAAKLRNAKIRLSNIKLDEIVQVFRGKSKWLKF
jgi:hypothetical protein